MLNWSEKFLCLKQQSHFLSGCPALHDVERSWRGSTTHPFKLTSSEMAGKKIRNGNEMEI